MKRIQMAIGSLFLFGAFLIGGCGIPAHVEKDPSVNLANYKTYAWLSDVNGAKKEGRAYSNFQERNLREIVAKQLEKYGWLENRSRPDVLIDYDIMVENDVKQESQSVFTRPYMRYFYNPASRRITSVYYPSEYLGENGYTVPYKSGTITINIVDTKSNNLVWQGWAETEVASRRLQQDDMRRIVKAIFKKFDASVASR